MQRYDLNDLDAFSAVAQARSFRGVAKLRGVSPSALSEALQRLETRLGVRLLNRTTRSVTPTEAGQRLLERLTPALAEVADALDTVNRFRDNPRGTLRLNVPQVVASLVLPPIVGPFLKAYPEIRMEIVAEDSFVDVLAGGFDAGVRYIERLERDMMAVPLGPRRQRYAAAASPAYLAVHGCPTHPRDLLEHVCIRHRFLGGTALPWEFERDGETVRVDPPSRVEATSPQLEVSLAVQGLGIVCIFEGFLAAALADGSLVRVLEPWTESFPGPFLYYASRRHMPAPLRAFVDFLKSTDIDG